MAADERAAHLELAPGARISDEALQRAGSEAQLSGISALDPAAREPRTVGHPVVADPLSALTNDRVLEGSLRRQAASFFQGSTSRISTVSVLAAPETTLADELVNVR